MEQEFKEGGGHLKEANPEHNKKKGKGYDNYGITNMSAYLEGTDESPALIPKNSTEENEALARALAESEKEAKSSAPTGGSGEEETQATTTPTGTPGEEQKDTGLRSKGAAGLGGTGPAANNQANVGGLFKKLIQKPRKGIGAKAMGGRGSQDP